MRSYILLLILLFAIVCQGKGQTENNLPEEENSEQTGDTLRAVISTKFPGTAYPLIFEAAYFPGTTVDQGDMHYHFEVADLGKIKIESGKIIACDPIVMQDGVAFAQAFPNGQFDVQLAVAKPSAASFSQMKQLYNGNSHYNPGKNKLICTIQHFIAMALTVEQVCSLTGRPIKFSQENRYRIGKMYLLQKPKKITIQDISMNLMVIIWQLFQPVTEMVVMLHTLALIKMEMYADY